MTRNLSILGAVVLLLLPHLHPPLEAKEATPPGNVVIEIIWPAEIDADVDLWVEAPGDVPVGYSNKGGTIFNLLRDDLGHSYDVTEINYEVSYSRGVPAGEYTANVHLFRFAGQTAPLPVTVVASVKNDIQDSAKQLVVAKLVLGRQGEEITAFRFTLDADGGLVPGSVHNLQRGLRTGGK